MSLIIQQKLSKREKKITTWREAKSKGKLDNYFSGVPGWNSNQFDSDIEVEGIIPSRTVESTGCLYSGDIQDYYLHEGISNYQKAIQMKKTEEYFSGIGIFPKISVSPGILYTNDYQEFIASLTHEEYLILLSHYSQHKPSRHADYTSPVIFYQTAMTQITEYIKVLKDLEEPVYIPGDGIGIASYACSMLGKKYVSSEPSLIGREAFYNRLITYQEPFQEDRLQGCKTMFLGNVIKHIDQDLDKYRNRVVVAIYDEQGFDMSPRITFQSSYDLDPVTSRTYYSLGSYKSLISERRKEEFCSYNNSFFSSPDETKYWLPGDQLAKNMLIHDSYVRFSGFDFEAKWKLIIEEDQSRNEDVRRQKFIAFLYTYNYAAFLRYVVQFKIELKKTLIYVVTSDRNISGEISTIAMSTRSYLKDYIHGKPGNQKLLRDVVINVYPNVCTILDNGYYSLQSKNMIERIL
jgi:hypothetical protein